MKKNNAKKLGPFWLDISSEFKTWRDEHLEYAKDLCQKLGGSKMEESTEVVAFLRDFPKCMVQFTREICKCNINCFMDSFIHYHFHNVCHNLKNDKIFLSLNYTFCNNYNIRISDGQMFKFKDFHSDHMLSDRIEMAMKKICDNDKKYYNQLQCALYELKEECESDFICFKKFLRPVSFEDCQNPNYAEQIKKIEKLVGLDEISLNYIFSDLNDSTFTSNNESNYNVFKYSKIILSQPISESSDISNVINPYKIFIGIAIFSALGFFILQLFKKKTTKTNPISENNANKDTEF